ncbi:ABC transporter substrate-binding protein [Candidatus Poriferisocius sp.]|uniref:ABC transporter substrate-binding protein n=1 Tax=Candidatus Poriferisocius sp. TaxID=3101276 RepID=UPI003B01328A
MKAKIFRQPKLWRFLALLGALVMVATACGNDDGGDTQQPEATMSPTAGGEGEQPEMPAAGSEDEPAELTEVSLQLQWVPQSQFAGYFAARDLGFYEDVGLDVEIIDGGLDIVPATVLDSGGADFAISWVPRGLVPREEGLNITNIAQVFQRSGTLQVSFAEAGINEPADLAGKKVGNWGFGNEFELFAGLNSVGLDPKSDVTLVQQDFNMTALINGDIDAAQAMIYNEYAQVLETINPETGELFQPEDLRVIDWNEVGTAMLQDAIWADADRLESHAKYRDIAVRFVEASLRGWIHCRDNFQECVDIIMAASPLGGPGHQAWMMNEINALIWPSPGGVGIMDQALYDQTIEVATSQGVLASAPDAGAFRTDIAQEAVDNLRAAGHDVFGNNYARQDVQVTEGGQ